MCKNRFVSVGKKISENQIAMIEADLGITLPEELRNHYLKFNGGRPQKCYYTNVIDTFVVDQFIPIKYGDFTFEDVYRQHVIEDKIIPSYLIPFAIDPGGDYFCISVRAEDKGKVFFFWTEFYEDLKRAVRLVAPSFEDFIESMKKEPPE